MSLFFVLALRSPFFVTPQLMKQVAKLVRRYRGVQLHSHLVEDLEASCSCCLFPIRETKRVGGF